MPSQLHNVSWISRMLGIGPRFQGTLLHLIRLGYKCRIRLPLFISAGFVLCHIFGSYIPPVEINVEFIEDNSDEEDDVEEGELSLASEEEEEEDSDEEAAELAVVLNIVGSNQ